MTGPDLGPKEVHTSGNLKFGIASALLVRDSDLGFGIEQINFDQRPGKLCG